MAKVKMLISRGSPLDGAIIRKDATVELPDFWAKIFINDGSAVLLENTGKEEKPKKGKSKDK